MTIRIVTDSTCDLPPDRVARWGIQVVPMYINVGDQGFRDGVDLTREAFYQRLPAFPVHPTTAAPSPEAFRSIYAALAAEGATHILSIHVAGTLSAVVNVARSVAREITAVPITVIDSQQLSLGIGFLVETAARLAVLGRSVVDILAAVQDQIARTQVFAALDTLEYLRRSGRLNGLLAGFGTILQLKPLLTLSHGVAGTERVRTRRRATERLLEMLRAVGPLEQVALLHAHAVDRANELRGLAAEWLPAGEILTVDITPVLGAHLGPGAVGFAAVAARRDSVLG